MFNLIKRNMDEEPRGLIVKDLDINHISGSFSPQALARFG